MSHVSDPSKYGVAITPSDVTNLSAPTRGIYVGVPGNVSVVQGGATVVYANAPSGVLPIEVTRVNATGTTASSLVAMW